MIKSMRLVTGRRTMCRGKSRGYYSHIRQGDEVNATIDRLGGIEGLSLYGSIIKENLGKKKRQSYRMFGRNENTGGAGGFTRGLQLVREDQNTKTIPM